MRKTGNKTWFPSSILGSKKSTELHTTSAFTVADLKAVPPKYRKIIPDYIKDCVSLTQFAA